MDFPKDKKQNTSLKCKNGHFKNDRWDKTCDLARFNISANVSTERPQFDNVTQNKPHFQLQ